MKEIILASASPRRFDLLRQIGLRFSVMPSNMEETINLRLDAYQIAESLASQKAFHVSESLRGDFLVIGADTIVVKEGILGKPENEDHAFEMLSMLRGQWHEVITGIAVVDSTSKRVMSGYEKTRVKMRELSDENLWAYIRTGEPMDKAGSYGIQGMGALLVEKIEGCYFNVVGLPLTKLWSMLEPMGVQIL